MYFGNITRKSYIAVPLLNLIFKLKKNMVLLSSFSQWLASQEVQVGITIVTFTVTILAFMFSKVRSDIIALCSTAVLLTTGVINPKAALAGFSNSAVVIMIGLFIVGGAVFQTGLARVISSKLLKLAGTDEKRLFFLVMLVTAFVAAFVSNTGTVALLLPIILAMSKSAKVSPSTLMMPLAFASSMGGVLTLIGTPPNLIVSNYLAENNLPQFGFFDFTPIGLILIAVGMICLWPLCRFFLGKKSKEGIEKKEERSLSNLLSDYHIDDCLFRLRAVSAHSLLEGRTAAELDIHKKYGVTLLEVRRESRSLFNSVIQEPVKADTVFNMGDTLYVLGHRDQVETFAERHNMMILPDEEKYGKVKLDFYEIGLTEILITPESALINRPLRSANFKERYGLSVLAIKRKGKYKFDEILDENISNGDMLLMHGPWKGIESLAKKSREWLVIGRPEDDAENVPLDHKAPIAAVIMVLMVVAMVFEKQIGIPAVASVIVAGLAMVLTGCTRSVDGAYKMIGWESIVLIAGMMPMSTALTNTGISKWIAENLVGSLEPIGPIAVMAGVYVVTSLLSTFISNSATAILVAPIAWAAAQGMGVNPEPLMMTAAVAASACFATPICTPPNAMVMNAGHYTFMDYVKVGLPLQIIMGIVALLTIPLFFPFEQA